MPYDGVRLRGLTELNRAFRRFGGDLSRDVRETLKEAGEPVRRRAEQLAVSEISHIGPVWSQMRIGVATDLIYVAPALRRHGGSPRPNLARLLMEKSMEPAVEQSGELIVRALDEALRDLADFWAA